MTYSRDYPISDDIQLLREQEVCEALGGIHRATLYRMVRAGRFPAPVKVSDRIKGWTVKQVREHLNRCSSEQKEVA